MKISIKGRIVRSFFLLILLMLATQLGFNVFFSKNVFVVQNKQQVESLYNTIVQYYSDDTDVLYNLTREADTTLGYSIQVLSEDGVVYTSRTMATGEGKLPEVGNPMEAPFEGNNVTEDITPESLEQGQSQGPNGGPGMMKPDGLFQGEEVPQMHLEQGPSSGRGGVYSYDLAEYSEEPEVDIMTPAGSDMEVLTLRGKTYYEGEARYINIALPMESITNSIDLFTKSNMFISLVVLLLGIWVVVEIANSITRPIKNMQKVSEKLADLDFSDEVDENAKTREITSLAQSINSMSKQLENAMVELQLANTELQKDVERQKELDIMRKQFVANVSHEMKTPLALVQIYCDNLKNNIEGIDREKYCDIIIEETQRLDKIVGDMLNVSKLENELLQPYKVELDFSEVVVNLVETMMPLLEGYKVSTEIDENIHVQGDKAQLEEAMRNFIMNAICHTPSEKVIEIKLKRSHKKVCFSVFNEGSKIAESDMARLWESFYKSNSARTRTQGINAGLGLYVVKLTMDNHKGSYNAENLDSGVKFTFTLNEL